MGVHILIKNILVPLDGSELAEAALGPALKLAQAMAAELVLLRVTILQWRLTK
jgi:nucleotide-binding universal stress UspA family protein